MVYVPPGNFILGFGPAKYLKQFMNDQTAGRNAQPSQTLNIDGFYIDRFEVTYKQFLLFKPQAKYEGGRQNEPIRGVSWYEADAYCMWIGKRLPTEFEWEKTARGTDDRLFVWGNEFKRENANLGNKVLPVGNLKTDVSPFQVHDMNGNVSEWMANWYQSYPNSEYEDENFGERYKVIRGGAFQKKEHGFMKEFTMLSYRNFSPPDQRFWDTGFRCSKSSP